MVDSCNRHEICCVKYGPIATTFGPIVIKDILQGGPQQGIPRSGGVPVGVLNHPEACSKYSSMVGEQGLNLVRRMNGA